MDANQPSPEALQVPPRRVSPFVIVGAVLFGAVIGGVLVEYWMVTRGTVTTVAQTTAGGDVGAEVERLSSLLPTQSHTMKDVGDHWVALWFAAQEKNWPLARFHFDQGRQQIRWTLAIRPERMLPPPAGGTVNLRGMFVPMDMSTFAALQLTIEDEDTGAFEAAYKASLEACLSCHTAVEMPFLRPTIPTVRPSTIISLAPTAP